MLDTLFISDMEHRRLQQTPVKLPVIDGFMDSSQLEKLGRGKALVIRGYPGLCK